MRPVVGIICEYDPFHRGHARQFQLIRDRLPDARILCVMSGCFTQRGMPALHMPRVRAQAALDAGADMVLELPCAFALRDAEHFALGGVSILTQLGFVTHISFGAEDDLALLAPAAQLLHSPTPAFTQALHNALGQGLSFAAAQGRALSTCLPGGADAWQKPNNILALCYLRALQRLHSPLQPLPVLRLGDYHSQQLLSQPFPSATAVRAAFLAGDHAAANDAAGYTLPLAPVCRPDAADLLLMHRLRTTHTDDLRALPDCTEGLEHRLKACAAKAATRTELLALLKTKRYAHARLSRLCAHALLGVTQQLLDAHPLPHSARLLGLRRSADDLTAALSQSGICVAASVSQLDMSHPICALDERAYELWALCACLPSGLWHTQGVAVI